ncbi:uncharacterized protein LOC144488268, partial [Mustelus asterias]
LTIRRGDFRSQSLLLVVSRPELVFWRGQNRRTLQLGLFPPACVTPCGSRGAPFISPPLRSSLIHSAHGDIDPRRSWGFPDKVNGMMWNHLADNQNPIQLLKMSGLSRSLDSNIDNKERLTKSYQGPEPNYQGPGPIFQGPEPDFQGPGPDFQGPGPNSQGPGPNSKAVSKARSRQISEEALAFRQARGRGNEKPRRVPREGRRWAAEAEDALGKLRLKPSQPRPNCWSVVWPQVDFPLPGVTRQEQDAAGRLSIEAPAKSASSQHYPAESKKESRASRPSEPQGRPRGTRGNYLRKGVSEDTRTAQPEAGVHRHGSGPSLQEKVNRVQDAVHGVTTEECRKALQITNFDTYKTIQHLKVQQLYNISQKSREECQRLLQDFSWNLENASQYVLKSKLKS